MCCFMKDLNYLIYINKIEKKNGITFKIKAGYYLELLIPDVSKLSKFSYNLVDFNVKVKFM